MPMVNGKWVSSDEALELEFGKPEDVVRQAHEDLHREAQERLTGMEEEQREWEGAPGDMHKPRGYYARADSLDWPIYERRDDDR